MKRIIIGISGSSSPLLGIRLLEVLGKISEIETHLVVSDSVEKTLAYEASDWSVSKLLKLATKHYGFHEMAAPIASGSFLTDGMIVCPCSMRSLAAIAMGQGDNLLTRAADVTLKERRPLILVTRETPLNLAHLRNMVSVTEMGGVILPPIMAFYQQPKNISDLIDHTIGKVLDVLRIPHELFRRWTGTEK
jgi:flavin prenyltransferase